MVKNSGIGPHGHHGVKLTLNLLSVAGLFVAWDILVRLQVYRFGLLPSPVEVWDCGLDWIKTPEFWIDAGLTAARVFGGVATACLVGIPLGLMIGWKKNFSDLTVPVVEILRPIPGIAYIPLAILFLPWEEASTAFICFIGAVFPIILNTVTGVRLIDGNLFRAARCLGASEARIFRQVVLPGALPSIAVGASLGMGIGWMASVAGEMISGKYGLGYRIWESYTLIRYPLIVVDMVVIGLLGLASSALVRFVFGKLIPWRKAFTESLDQSISG